MGSVEDVFLVLGPSRVERSDIDIGSACRYLVGKNIVLAEYYQLDGNSAAAILCLKVSILAWCKSLPHEVHGLSVQWTQALDR